MATWTQSHFLQALGWAILNSLWQMALLWAVFLGVNRITKLSSSRRYQFSVAALLVGFVWTICTFIFYYQNPSSTYAFFEKTIAHSNYLLHASLFAASLTYLLLLLFHAARLYKNWRFVQLLKTEGHQKAGLEYRLFAQKVAFLLGISRKVKVVVSSLVSSPLTVGYLKPIILLPVAAMANLTTAQVEAILLHELSHIRRHDYLVNFLASVIHTILYFNPFVKSFMQVIDAEREACCDQTVLQFGYDKVSYASALLHLEKSASRQHALVLAAAGKQNLLNRIEKIVGMEKKRPFRLVQVVPLFLATFCIVLFNSVLIINDAKKGEAMSYASNAELTPWQFNNKNHEAQKNALPLHVGSSVVQGGGSEKAGYVKIEVYNLLSVDEAQPIEPLEPPTDHVVPVAFDEVDGTLTTEEKENVKKTVEATKKIAQTLHWKAIENSIADVMSSREKASTKLLYMNELNKAGWKNIEQNLKANYDQLNWEEINRSVDSAMAQVKLDSIQTLYAQALDELQDAQRTLKSKVKCAENPIPDISVRDLHLAQETLQKSLDSINKLSAKPKKTIRL